MIRALKAALDALLMAAFDFSLPMLPSEREAAAQAARMQKHEDQLHRLNARIAYLRSTNHGYRRW